MRLLVTRPAPDNERTRAELEKRSHTVMLAPLLRIEPVADADLGPAPFDIVVLTSAGAARAIATHPRVGELLHRPLFAVGERSAEAAREAGFRAVESANGNADALADLVRGRACLGETILYLAGEERTGELEAALAREGFAVRTSVIYRAVAERTLPGPVRAAMAEGCIDGLLHYSARTAQAFVSAAHLAGLWPQARDLRHFCLSAQVAVPLKAADMGKLHIAAAPREPDLLALVNTV